MLRRGLARMVVAISSVKRRLHEWAIRPALAEVGRSARIHPDGVFSFARIRLGNHSSIGPGAVMLAVSPAYIDIGPHVMIGPNVSFVAGDHVIDRVGVYMTEATAKRPGDDLPIIVESDVWIGAGATVLKGVTIGRGAVVAAGAVVTRNVEPYSIVGGVPASQIGTRFSRDEAQSHEMALHDREIESGKRP